MAEELDRPLPPPLLALTPGDLATAGAARYAARVSAAVGAGLRGVLLRERDLLDATFLDLAREVRAILDSAPGRGWLGVHDRAHLAGAARADGVHLGYRSLEPREARRVVGAGVALGLSAHAGDEPEGWEGADYLVYGPVNATPSKEGLLEPIGTAGLAAGVEAAGGRPVWAIGGLGPDDVAAVLGAGAAGLACLSGVLACADPAAATRACLAAMDRAREMADA